MTDPVPELDPYPEIPGWVQFHINMSNSYSQYQYTWAYKSSSNILSPTTLNGLCQDLWNIIVVPWKTIHPVSLSLDSVSGETRYPAALDYSGVYNAPAPTGGNVAQNVMPGNVALSWALKSGVRGRKYNGRTFLGQLTEPDCQGDLASNSYMTSAALFMLMHLTALSRDSITLSPAVASRRGGFMTEINRVVATAVLDSQRRRLTGRGM